MTDCSGLIRLEAVKQQFYNPIEQITQEDLIAANDCKRSPTQH